MKKTANCSGRLDVFFFDDIPTIPVHFLFELQIRREKREDLQGDDTEERVL